MSNRAEYHDQPDHSFASSPLSHIAEPMSILYILVNKKQSAFKIGISHHPHSRAKTLPVEIDTERSLEIEIQDGNALKAERVLQYLFRHWRYDMPRGDGYTEWFRINALAQVMSFVRAHADKLGIGHIRALKIPDRPASPGRGAPLRETREARTRRRARERAERLEHAKAHNQRVLEWHRNAFVEMEKSNTIAGLIRPRPDDPYGDGYLYLHGAQRNHWAEILFDNREGLNRTIGSGFSVIFPGGYCDGDYPLVEINVNRNYLVEDEDARIWDARLPGAAAIRSFLSKYARDIGTQDDIDLRECHADLAILQKDFWNRFHGAGPP
ncbi:GIY-YIG nuclease family protein [Burkholderia cepacia]|uniref:GIY-YIG nuclease family protein n=1 Tax=Burkholderia cepacia TaxID=292 RepID=UPI000F5A64BE|nr:GIY-YIG nuclease family protein [Burkholderia cepacia]MDN7897895.1 GIY-YIG nuclease family protein [Burkholderia cepacia]